MRDQFGRTERLEGVQLYHSWVDVARRLDGGGGALQQPQGKQQQLRPPEVDLYFGETALSLSSSPAACKVKDGDVLYVYRYGEACRRHQARHKSQGNGGSSSDQDGVAESGTLPLQQQQLQQQQQELEDDEDDEGGAYVALYLSDWLCGYQRRFMMHHDLSVPWEVLLLPFCSWRGIKPDEASFVWLQIYRQVRAGDG